MRYAIISDIHSNIQALEKAFKDFETENIDEIICLGDVVGYNAKPV
jgi:predicted phosphodiesterase